ncbi:MAG: hypothetical protein ACREX6_03510, partial [Casimicrobiaceae bacterium]
RLSLASSSPSVDTQNPATLTATLEGASLQGYVVFRSGVNYVGGAALDANSASVRVPMAAGIHSLSAHLSTPEGNVDSTPLLQVIDQPLVCVR